MELRLKIALTARQSEFDRAVERYLKVFYGGAKGGGKSHGLRLIMLKRRIQYPGSVGYIFRKTFQELNFNHIVPLFKQFPELSQFWNKGEKTLYLPNGSMLCFQYIEHAHQLEKFQGREMNDLAIEEAGDWPFSHYEYLQMQVRSATPGIPVRTLLTGNPGGIGHTWLKRLFITRQYEEGETPEDHHFVPARVEDNPAIMVADPGYVKRLETIRDPALRKAWRDGSWDITAGQFFEELRREIHVCRPFKVPDWWPRFGAYDYGYGHPASFGWYATNGDGRIFKYRELVKARCKIKDFAKLLHAHPDTKNLEYIVAGHDCWAKRDSALGEKLHQPSIAEAFAEEKIFLQPAGVDRVQGARRLREYLSPQEGDSSEDADHARSKLTFFENCVYTFDCLTRMVRDPDNAEDVLKVDSEHGDPMTGDDPYDETRYAIMSRPSLAEKPASRPRDKYRKSRKRPSKGWTVA